MAALPPPDMSSLPQQFMGLNKVFNWEAGVVDNTRIYQSKEIPESELAKYTQIINECLPGLKAFQQLQPGKSDPLLPGQKIFRVVVKSADIHSLYKAPGAGAAPSFVSGAAAQVQQKRTAAQREALHRSQAAAREAEASAAKPSAVPPSAVPSRASPISAPRLAPGSMRERDEKGGKADDAARAPVRASGPAGPSRAAPPPYPHELDKPPAYPAEFSEPPKYPGASAVGAPHAAKTHAQADHERADSYFDTIKLLDLHNDSAKLAKLVTLDLDRGRLMNDPRSDTWDIKPEVPYELISITPSETYADHFLLWVSPKGMAPEEQLEKATLVRITGLELERFIDGKIGA